MTRERNKQALRNLADRLRREFRPITEHGDQIILADYEADALAEAIAEYVDAVFRPLPLSKEEGK